MTAGNMDANSRRVEGGKLLANPPEGEDVVITGLAGCFPNSNDVYEFRDNLFHKVDLCDDDTRRWEHTHPEIPKRSGKIYHADKFDAEFFGIPQREVECVDPLSRILLERIFEAVLDAGLHPDDLAGTRTGVFIGSCFSESEKHICFDDLKPLGMGIVGSNRSMQAHRISYWLKLEGPSYVSDTACSSAQFALEHAYRAIRTGQCDSALVGGANLCLHPFLTLKFANLGVLSPEGICKPFDAKANGYTRSEAIAAVLLQKSKDAKRIYARILHAKLNVDGYKEQGITYPSGDAQRQLLEDVFEECGVPLDKVTYIEAHGTGTKVGDPEELKAIDEVFLGHRSRPLLIGSVKSSIGHTEPVSGLCSLTKVIIGMESGLIPPNINYSSPRVGVQGLELGRLKVVDSPTHWPDQDVIVGVNCFGFGGANSHVLLQWNGKAKRDVGTQIDDVPRLVCVSGRTGEAVEKILDDLANRTLDYEFVGLLHNIYRKNINGHHYRGFSLVSKCGVLARSFTETPNIARDLYFVCSEFIEKSATILGELKDFFAMILNKASIFKKLADLSDEKDDSFITTLVLQIALLSIYKTIGVKCKLIAIGKLGVLIDLYTEHIFTLDQILTIGTLIEENKNNSLLILGQQLYDKISEYVRYNEAECIVKKVLSSMDGEKIKFQNMPINNTIITSFEKHISQYLDPRISTAQIFGTKDCNNNCAFNLLISLGSLYELGVDMSLDQLYPAVEWPVSRGTAMISPLIKWKHDKEWFLSKYGRKSCSGEKKINVNMKDTENLFLTGHIIDGRNLYPATGYILLVWESFAIMQRKIYTAMQLVFENVKFNRATNIPQDTIEFIVSIKKSNGDFEVSEGGNAIVTGRIYEIQDVKQEIINLPKPHRCESTKISYEKDVYKELRLRGYNYKGLFRGIQEFRGTEALVQWKNNWVAFMDNLLQLQILQEDTRNLYVPTCIERFVIDAKSHVQETMNLNENAVLPAYIYTDLGIIRSQFVEIRGLKASSITKRRNLVDPVLEKYQFVSNSNQMTLHEAMRVNTQIILENCNSIQFKAAAVVLDDVYCCEELINCVQEVFDNEPLVRVDLNTILDVQNDRDQMQSVDFLVIAESFKNSMIDLVLNSISNTTFVISRELISFNLQLVPNNLRIITAFSTSQELIVMYKRSTLKTNKPSTLNISDINSYKFNWLPQLQELIKTSEEVIIYAQNDPESGIIGLSNCMRREPGLDKIRCVYINDKDAPEFDPDDHFYKNQLDKGLYMNVYQNGTWGTYRHLLLNDQVIVRRDHCYANTLVRGDLSSIRWIEGPLRNGDGDELDKSLVYVYYAALNFRDIMTASGRINIEAFVKNRLEQHCVQGIEFSGRNKCGQRVMGMMCSGALGTLVSADNHLLFRVPDSWSLEEAATVPVVYGTVLYAFFMRADLKPGQSVLIHAGTGGVGQAAINVALQHGCTVFTTVGTDDKRAFIREHYPQIRPQHIGCSRDTSFEQMVLQQTKGRGVDLVLNSLAEEKLQASIRCLANGGRFIEIGKFDLALNNALKMDLFKKECTFHGIMLDSIFSSSSMIKLKLSNLIRRSILNGSVRPLPKTCFKRTEVEEAFRFMSTGKHIGKVLIRIRHEERGNVIVPLSKEQFNCVPKFYCTSNRSYIILGGLGGFGLELADWLVTRGARNLVLTSRSGVRTGYQQQRINLWTSYGVKVLVLTDDILTREGCWEIINKANALGTVDSIFNLAVVLKDALLTNQTIENYQVSFGPKPCSTKIMDQLTRTLCPNLRDFVVFSSVSCGRGNAGQTNYGMANSVMERVCEQRVQLGLPGLAIQWGAIADVGLVAEMQEEHVDLVIGGTLQQRIVSCLEVLDRFLRQPDPVVASMVVAEKKSGGSGAGNMVDAVVNIMGIRDLKTISLHSTLPELGMDSMMAVEVKQTLEREYEVFLTPQDIRSMTFARLQEISLEKSAGNTTVIPKINAAQEQVLFNSVATEDVSNIPIVRLKTIPTKNAKKIILFPGLEGNSAVFNKLAKHLNANIICFQYGKHILPTTIREIAESIYPSLVDILAEDRTFNIIAHSFGSLIALDLVTMLEQDGYQAGNLILLDGGLELMQKLVQTHFKTSTEELFQTRLLTLLLSALLPEDIVTNLEEDLVKCSSYEERIRLAHNKSSIIVFHSIEYIETLCLNAYNRIKAVANYKAPQNWPKVQCRVRLYRPTIMSVADVTEDHRVSEICEQPVEVCFFEGDHLTMIDNPELAQEINNALNLGHENDTLKKADSEAEGPITRIVTRK